MALTNVYGKILDDYNNNNTFIVIYNNCNVLIQTLSLTYSELFSRGTQFTNYLPILMQYNIPIVRWL